MVEGFQRGMILFEARTEVSVVAMEITKSARVICAKWFEFRD